MENKVMGLASKKWVHANKTPDVNERDKYYHQVTILRELARYSEQFGEAALSDLFVEITEEVLT